MDKITSADLLYVWFIDIGHLHGDGAHCGCGYLHVPNSEMLDNVVNSRTKAMVVVRPCSGAIISAGIA